MLLGELKRAERVAATLADWVRRLQAESAEDAEIGELIPYYCRGCNPYARRAYARALQGKTTDALLDYERTGRFEWEVNTGPMDKLGGQTTIEYVDLLLRLGRLKDAERSLRFCRRSVQGYPVLEMACDVAHADLFRLQGDYEASRDHLQPAIAWSTHVGHQQIYTWAYLAKARLHLAQAEWNQAEEAIQEALTAAEESELRIYLIDALNTSGRIALHQSGLDAAHSRAQRALDLAAEATCGYAWGEGNALHLLGEIRQQQGEREAAASLLEEAAAVRRRIRDPRLLNTEELLAQLT
jgi:tetratricopeptide (TPR) repeat protein